MGVARACWPVSARALPSASSHGASQQKPLRPVARSVRAVGTCPPLPPREAVAAATPALLLTRLQRPLVPLQPALWSEHEWT